MQFYQFLEELVQYDLANFRKALNRKKKSISILKRGYSAEEMRLIWDDLQRTHERRPHYLPAYAIELQILLGLRRGEAPVLKWSDFNDKEGIVYIQRELLDVKGTSDYHIDESTKTEHSRKLAITPKVRETLSKIRKAHTEMCMISPFLFPAQTELGCITNAMIYQHFNRLCKRNNIAVSREIIRGVHALRRNFETDVYNVSDKDTAADMTGNTKPVFDNHYSMGMSQERLLEIQMAAGR